MALDIIEFDVAGIEGGKTRSDSGDGHQQPPTVGGHGPSPHPCQAGGLGSLGQLVDEVVSQPTWCARAYQAANACREVAV